MKSSVLFIILFNVAFCSSLARGEKSVSPHRYTVSWDFWYDNTVPGRYEQWKAMEIRLNGKSIGPRSAAFKFLEKLPVKDGERIKLDLPARDGRVNEAPGHMYSSFVQRWLEKGASVDWYEGGKKYEVHTVTWTDAILDGDYVKNMDDLTWIVNGKKIGKGEKLGPFIEAWQKRSDLVIQIVVPLGGRRSLMSGSLGRFFPALQGINDGSKIRVYEIIEERVE